MTEKEYRQCVEAICEILNKYNSTKSNVDKIIAHVNLRAESTSKHTILQLDEKFDTNEIAKL